MVVRVDGPTVSGREEEPAALGHRGETGDEDPTAGEARDTGTGADGADSEPGDGELLRPFRDQGSGCLEPKTT